MELFPASEVRNSGSPAESGPLADGEVSPLEDLSGSARIRAATSTIPDAGCCRIDHIEPVRKGHAVLAKTLSTGTSAAPAGMPLGGGASSIGCEAVPEHARIRDGA